MILEEIQPIASDLQSWQWWTQEEKQQAVKQFRTLSAAAAIINTKVPGLYNYISWKCFRQEVLDKYRNNVLCDVGREYITFLEDDKRTSVSTVNFYLANIDGVLMVQYQDYIFVPPREKSHWEHYKIPVKFEPMEQQQQSNDW